MSPEGAPSRDFRSEHGPKVPLAVVHTALGRVGGAERQLVRFVVAARALGFPVDLFYGGPQAPGLSELRNLFHEAVGPRPDRVLASYLRLLSQLKRYRAILIYHHLDPVLLAAVAILQGEKCVTYIGEPLRPLWEEYVSGDASLVSAGAMETTVEQLYGGPATFVLSHPRLFKVARWVLRRVDRASMRMLRGHVANSLFTAKAVQVVYGLEKLPAVVYQGIPPPKPEPESATERTIVLNVGAFLPMKEQATLLRAWQEVSDLPAVRNYALVLAGSGPLLATCQELASTLGVHRVRFVPDATDEGLNDLYSRTDVLVHCAVAEPFGMTPVEAAAFRVPSIVANSGGLPEFVLDGVTGWLFPPRDTEKLATVLRSALADPSRCRQMGENAYRRMLEHFTIEENARGLIEQVRCAVPSEHDRAGSAGPTGTRH